MITLTPDLVHDRAAARAWYQRNRRRSRQIFDLIDPAVYYSRPIALRNPIVFYEGHLPAFSVIAFLRRGLGRPPVNERLEQLFARGIDPDTVASAAPRSGASTSWPSRDDVLAFGDACDRAVVEAIDQAPLENDRPALRRGEGLYTALEHEAMHQETLLYMWHRLAYEQKRAPQLPRGDARVAPPARRVHVPRGRATIGARRDTILFGWDNEFEGVTVDVPAFDVDAFDITNAEFLAFVESGGYRTAELWDEAGRAWLHEERVEHPAFWLRDRNGWSWRGMFASIPLPLNWPVYVSQAEAAAYARWKGRRLMTEAQFHRAAYGTPSGEERTHPWGEAAPTAAHGNFDFESWDPVPVGSHPAGASAWGIEDLVGNGWEWTETVFGPLPGFEPMASYPEYSAEFFDGQHYVMKGASPATARELIRPSFRNWFRSTYPYVYATFRTVATG